MIIYSKGTSPIIEDLFSWGETLHLGLSYWEKGAKNPSFYEEKNYWIWILGVEYAARIFTQEE